jgi:hypothetical protein
VTLVVRFSQKRAQTFERSLRRQRQDRERFVETARIDLSYSAFFLFAAFHVASQWSRGYL